MSQLTVCLQYVNKQEQEYPYNIYEVPVPARRFKAEMVVSSEVTTTYGAQPLNQQHRHAHQDVKAVKAG